MSIHIGFDPIPIDGQSKAPGTSLANPEHTGMRRCDPTRNGSILSVTYDTGVTRCVRVRTDGIVFAGAKT